MAELQIVLGLGLGQSFPLGDSPLIIGRHGSSQIQLWDPKVSREHSRIEGYHVLPTGRQSSQIQGPIKRFRPSGEHPTLPSRLRRLSLTLV